jgi:hypothetical protein
MFNRNATGQVIRVARNRNGHQAKFNRGPDPIRVGILCKIEDFFKVGLAEALMKPLA